MWFVILMSRVASCLSLARELPAVSELLSCTSSLVCVSVSRWCTVSAELAAAPSACERLEGEGWLLCSLVLPLNHADASVTQ